MAVLTVEVLLVEVERLAILAGFVGAAMSVELLLAQCTCDRYVATYWARLSEREKALLHRGQT